MSSGVLTLFLRAHTPAGFVCCQSCLLWNSQPGCIVQPGEKKVRVGAYMQKSREEAITVWTQERWREGDELRTDL